MSTISDLLYPIQIPRMVKVRQSFPDLRINDIEQEVRNSLDRPDIISSVKPGMTVAVTAGSRGIDNYAVVIGVVVAWLKEHGADPFIVAAMGSHGGVTVEGQRQILAGYGITEDTMKCPLRIGTETSMIGKSEHGYDVFIDSFAAKADGVVAVNRIKPHTGFRGPWESGLMKMLTIGLGKQTGAEVCHSRGMGHMAEMVPEFGKAIIDNVNVLFGVGLIEDAYDHTAEIHALTSQEFITVEPELLKRAKALIGRILLDETDLLIVDEIGKNISGAGMDPNVTGTFASKYASGGIRAQRVAVLDLTEESHGNSNGLGLAHVSTKRVLNKFNPEMTYPNSLTGRQMDGARIPMIFSNDMECIKAGIQICPDTTPKTVRIIRIHNTLSLEEIWVSENLIDLCNNTKGMTVLTEPKPLAFNSEGNLF